MVPIAHGEAYAAGLKTSSGLKTIKGAGHAAHLEAPDEAAQLVLDILE